ATQEFADLVAEHARKQFEESRLTLAKVKDRLRSFARSVLVEQVNAVIKSGRIDKVVTRFVGQWEWSVELQRADSRPTIFLEFGPTAVAENARRSEETRLNSSHVSISYAVFCLKKKTRGE